MPSTLSPGDDLSSDERKRQVEGASLAARMLNYKCGMQRAIMLMFFKMYIRPPSMQAKAAGIN